MRKSFTQRSDKVKDGEVGSNQEGIAKGRDSLDTNKGTPKKNEANLTPAVQMRLTNCEDESEFETLEVIALDSGRQELGNEALDPLTEDVSETALMLSSHQKLASKSFSAEVRAAKDVETFLERPALLLGLHETSLQGIVDKMLEKLISVTGGEDIDFEDARMAFCTHDTVECLSKVIQGIEISEGGGWEDIQNWLIALGELPSIQQNHVAIAQLRHPVNLGRTLEETHIVVLVLAPSKAKSIKSSLETGRTFATLLADIETRRLLIEAETEEQFKKVLSDRKDLLSRSCTKLRTAKKPPAVHVQSRSSFIHRRDDRKKSELFSFGRGLARDLKRRLPHYLSDFKDGVRGRRTIPKLISTTLFLYFACLLPSIAFGVLNSRNTNGQIDVHKVIISQAVGGILFALFGGQPLIVLLTTAPLAIYVKGTDCSQS